MNRAQFVIILLSIILACFAPEQSRQEAEYDFVVTSDGAWTWFNDERAIVRNDRLYTSYVNSEGFVGLSVTDLNTGDRIGEEVRLSTWTEVDDHNNASLLFNHEGKLMAFYAKHHTDQFANHRISLVAEPESLEDWGQEVLVQSGANHTYNNAFQLSNLDNRIYNFSRTNGFNPNWKIYNADGSELTEDAEFIKSGNDKTRPYVKYASNDRDRIDFFFTDGHPRKTDNNLYHMYYKESALYQTDGTLIKMATDLPVLVSEVNKIYEFGQMSPTARPWTCSMNYSKEGRPVVTYSLQEDEATIDYYYAYWNDSVWVHRYIVDAGDALYDQERDYTGLAVINPYDVNEIFVSTNVDPITDNNTARYELYRGITTDQGRSFRWRAITSDSETDNLRPFVPKGSTSQKDVILWLQGDYRTYQDFDMKVVGKFLHSVSKDRVQRVYSQTDGSSRWQMEQKGIWRESNDQLSLIKPGDAHPEIRRPMSVATLSTEKPIGSFQLSMEVKCNDDIDTPGRDVIIVFGYQSPTRFYYAHLSNDNTIMPHNGIFIVDEADRKRIDDQGLDDPPEARMIDQEWHMVKIDRDLASGQIVVYMDDMNEPLMTATDKNIKSGYVGFGSFDNRGAVQNLVVREK